MFTSDKVRMDSSDKMSLFTKETVGINTGGQSDWDISFPIDDYLYAYSTTFLG